MRFSFSRIHMAVRVCLDIVACHGHYVFSSSPVDGIPLELPLHGVASFSEDTFVKLANLRLVMTSSFWVDEINIWFAKVFVVTKFLDCYQLPARMSFHTLCISLGWVLCSNLLGCASFVVHKIIRKIFFFQLLYGSICLVQHPVCVCNIVSANHCFQVKSSLEDRVITSPLGKCSDVAFSVTVSKPSFCLISFTDTIQDSNISLSSWCLSYDHQVRKFDEILRKTDEGLQKTVSIIRFLDITKWRIFEIHFVALDYVVLKI